MAPLPNQLNLFPDSFAIGHVAGTDEAGRGCLAGPVVAAATILPEKWTLPALDDSKKLSPQIRQQLSAAIKTQAVAFGYGIIWPAEIDAINILQASLKAMAKAVKRLRLPLEALFVDGNKTVPCHYFHKISYPYPIPEQKAIIAGDSLVPSISAASILAKTFRDKIMLQLDKVWPQYGFSRHKGYGTKEHFDALAEYGSSPMHRLSFRGVTAEKICRKTLL